MFERLEEVLRIQGRRQRGKIKLKNRVNITYPIGSITLFANKNKEIKLSEFKQIKFDLSLLSEGLYHIRFFVFPNHSYTKKGILIRMGKGKGKIDHFSHMIKSGNIFVSLIPKKKNNELEIPLFITKILKKYPFLSVKSIHQ